MKIRRLVQCGRRFWELDNGRLVLSLMEGGGHIAGLRLKDGPDVNPYWTPVWRTIEPWQYRPADAVRYGSQLLASISGHNLCLGWFGEPSPEEQRAGLGCHGEAPVRRWRVVRHGLSPRDVRLTYGCVLPVARMRILRTVVLRRDADVVYVCETLSNLARQDQPFTLCEHVTVGPPFLEKGVTVFDMSATRGHTFPGVFGKPQRLKRDTAFVWPAGPGRQGTVDLRRIESNRRCSSDFAALLMNRHRRQAWFSAVNPSLGLLLAYVWRSQDFPWVGNWEENYARRQPPWRGRTLARGMEFSNTPFPVGLRRAVDQGHFQGVPTYRWLPARTSLNFEYQILLRPVPRGCQGIVDIRVSGGEIEVAPRL